MLDSVRPPSTSANRGGLYSNEYILETDTATRYQAAIADLGQVALEDLPLGTLFEVVSTRVAQAMSVDLIAIMEVEDDIRLRLSAGYGWSSEHLGEVVVDWMDCGPASYPAILRGPIVDGFRGETAQLSGVVPPGITGISSVQTVPIGPVGRSNTPLGAFGVFTFSEREFNALDLIFLRSVAQLLASAIERSSIEEKLRTEAEERAILGEIARIIGSSLEIDEVYPLFAQQVRRLIEFDRITINLIDPETDTYSSAYVAGMTVEGWTKGVPEPISGKGVEAVSRTRSGIIVQGEGTAEFLKRYPRTQIGLECGLHSFLSVPVFWQGEVIGALALRTTAENAYSTGDMQVAERIAAQIAGSLANSALHATQKAYAREQATLAEISRVIDSSVRISEVYPRFAGAVRKLIPFDRIAISTVDEDNGTAMARYVWGIDFPGSALMVHRPMEGSATAAVTQARAGMIISPDNIMAEQERFGHLKVGLEAGLNSTLAVPMMSRGRVVGSLMLRSIEVDAYSLRDLTLAERVAVQISGAVRNVHLNEQLERSLLEQALLAELGRGTIQASDLTSVFDQLNKVLKSCFEFDRIELGIYDPERSSLHFDYVRGLPVAGMDEGYVLQRPAGARSNITWTDLMAAHSGPSYRDGMDGLEQAQAVQAAGLQSWLQFPLKSRDRVIGVISLRSKRQDAYVPSDLHLLERVAVQISPAVDNARFYLQAEQDAQQRIAIDKIIRAFGQTRNRSEILAKFRMQITDSIPADCVTVSATMSAFDESASEFNRLRHGGDQVQPELELANRKIAAAIVGTGSSLAIDCGLSDEDQIEINTELTDSLEQAGFRSSLSVPLLASGTTIGVLHFHWKEPRACSPAYRTLAEQAGMLLINALGPFTARGDPAETAFASSVKSQNPVSHISTSVILIDSQGMCRQVIRAAVQSEGITIAAESNSLEDAMQLMQSSGARLLIWEIHSDEDVDFGVVSSILEAYPDAGVVIIDNGCGAGIIGEVMRSGVRGLIRKDTTPVRMAEVLRAIATGETVFDPRVLKSYFERFPVYHTGNSSDFSATMKQLGERDLAILQAVANGQSNAEIAAALSFAVGTIKNRLARIYKVLGVSDRAGAMAFAIRTGIVA